MLGFHISKGGRTMSAAMDEDMALLTKFGFTNTCTQIFVSGPKSPKETLTEQDKEHLKRAYSDRIVVHGAYIDNPWNRAPGAVHNIKMEMRVCAKIGAIGLVVHLGAGAFGDTLRYVLEQLSRVEDDVKASCTIYFEINAAKSAEHTFETPQKINTLFERISNALDSIAAPVRLKVGLCVDSAHVFSCGVALADYNVTMDWLNALSVPSIMFHLNDSASELGSGKDRHEALTKGNLWRSYGADGVFPIEDCGLVAILDYAIINDSFVILERGAGLIDDLALIQQLGYF